MTYLEVIKEAQSLAVRLSEQEKEAVTISKEEVNRIRKALFIGRLTGVAATTAMGNPLCAEDEMPNAALEWSFAKNEPQIEPVWLITKDKASGEKIVSGPYGIANADLQGISVFAGDSSGCATILIPWRAFGVSAFFSSLDAQAALADYETVAGTPPEEQ